jgi:hypothetical protein
MTRKKEVGFLSERSSVPNSETETSESEQVLKRARTGGNGDSKGESTRSTNESSSSASSTPMDTSGSTLARTSLKSARHNDDTVDPTKLKKARSQTPPARATTAPDQKALKGTLFQYYGGLERTNKRTGGKEIVFPQTHGLGPLSCSVCSQTFKSPPALASHVANKHPQHQTPKEPEIWHVNDHWRIFQGCCFTLSEVNESGAAVLNLLAGKERNEISVPHKHAFANAEVADEKPTEAKASSSETKKEALSSSNAVVDFTSTTSEGYLLCTAFRESFAIHREWRWSTKQSRRSESQVVHLRVQGCRIGATASVGVGQESASSTSRRACPRN